MTPLAPAAPGTPSYTTGKVTVLLIGLNKLEPLTVSVTVTPVEDDVGVTTTDAVVADVGVLQILPKHMLERSHLPIWLTK